MIVHVLLVNHVAIVSTVKTFGPERGSIGEPAEAVALVQWAVDQRKPLIGDDESYIMLKPEAVVGYSVQGGAG